MVTPFLCSAADLQLIRAEHLPNTRGHRAEGSVSQRGGPGGPDLLAGYERSSHSLYLYDHFHVLFFFASPKAYSFCCLFIFIAEGIFI